MQNKVSIDEKIKSGTFNCRFCEGPLTPVLDLGAQPIANRLLKSCDDPEKIFPLQFDYCERCSLGMTNELPPEDQFTIFDIDYPYCTSVNNSYLEQCKRWVGKIVPKLKLHEGSSILEIACNDGYLLRIFQEIGIIVTGIEPVYHLAEKARKYGPVYNSFFSSACTSYLGSQDLVIANNVLAHVPDLRDFLRAVKKILKPNGHFSFEVPSLEKLVEDLAYDTIYHEHQYYFSRASLKNILSEFGFVIKECESIESHGGSFRVLACFGNGSRDTWNFNVERFATDVRNSKINCLQFIIQNAPIHCFGAAAKGITFLNYLGIKSDFIPYILDETPCKQRKYIPGVRSIILPVFKGGTWPMIILPWNFAAEMATKLRQLNYEGPIYYRRKGKFIHA